MFDYFDIHRVLVICPLRVGNVWANEIQHWEHLCLLQYSVAVGSESERLLALKTQADIYIINRENVQWLIEKSGVSFDFDMVVVDELSSFKNYQSKRFKALMKARPKVKRMVGLTGTPSSNGLMDLFAEFKLLDMGARLGRFIGQYRNAYFSPDKRNGQIIYNYKPLPNAEQQIYDKISDITISMKSTDHLKMPEMISTKYEVELSDSEKKKYEELEKRPHFFSCQTERLLPPMPHRLQASCPRWQTEQSIPMMRAFWRYTKESWMHWRILSNRQTASLSLWHIGFVTIWSVSKNALM